MDMLEMLELEFEFIKKHITNQYKCTYAGITLDTSSHLSMTKNTSYLYVLHSDGTLPVQGLRLDSITPFDISIIDVDLYKMDCDYRFQIDSSLSAQELYTNISYFLFSKLLTPIGVSNLKRFPMTGYHEEALRDRVNTYIIMNQHLESLEIL